MNIRTCFVVWICSALLSAFASNAAENPAETSDDPIVASFERELNHETPQPNAVSGSDIDSDILYERIAKPLQSPELVAAEFEEDQS